MKYFIVFSSISLMFAFLVGCSERSINQPSFQSNDQGQIVEGNLVEMEQGSEALSFKALLFSADPTVKREIKGEVSFNFGDKIANLEFNLELYDVPDIISAYIYLGDNYSSDKTPVVELFPAKRVNSTSNDPYSKTIAAGTITAKDLLFQLKGQNLEILYKLMSESKAFVALYTDRYHSGEIIGTIRPNEID